ncbi:hypothetical protein [Microtetraspora sp. NBRC 13810]|nr:hypothetical protein [Microtetraspora sp. NBRC 13810]
MRTAPARSLRLRSGDLTMRVVFTVIVAVIVVGLVYFFTIGLLQR